MSTTALTTHAEAVTRSRQKSVSNPWIGFAVVVVSAVMDLLDSTIAQTAAPATPDARLDLPSVALAAAGGFALVCPLIEGRQQGWPAW